MKEWISYAAWPEGVTPMNISNDLHETKEQAEAVCRLLKRVGYGGEGIHFPIKTWVVRRGDK